MEVSIIYYRFDVRSGAIKYCAGDVEKNIFN